MTNESSKGPRVAVIGAGPAGLFAAEHLVKKNSLVLVDVFDKLPVPYGLARYGVAPDNLKMKSVIAKLERIWDHPRVRFIGNVTFGVHLEWDDLSSHYDAIVFATGAPGSRELGVPGEELPGSIAVSDVVSWYNGYPDHRFSFDPSATAVAVIGAGNVALDATRLLARDPAGLAHTDIPDDVLGDLASSRVRDVHVLARRGVAHAKFSTAELRELAAIDEVDVIVDPDDLRLDDAAREHLATDRTARTVVDLLTELSTTTSTGSARCRVHLHFGVVPTAILGTSAVTGVRLRRTDATTEVLAVQMVIRSIGYRGEPLPGLPFTSATGTIPHDAGRVSDGTGKAFVVGWAKRGPTGVIGTNKACAGETITTLLASLPTHRCADGAADILALLASRAHAATTLEDCRRIERMERDIGRRLGRDRVKATRLADLLPASVGGHDHREHDPDPEDR